MVITRKAPTTSDRTSIPEKLIPCSSPTCFEGKKVPLYGDGLNVRDWLHVADNCRGLERVLRHGVTGEIYNLGAGNEVTNREITDTVLDVLGFGEEMIDYVADRPGTIAATR